MPRPLRKLISTLVRDYGWIHLSLGLAGNVMFFVGSVLFLPAFEPWKTFGVWLFVVGSFLMLIGSLGRFAVSMTAEEEKA